MTTRTATDLPLPSKEGLSGNMALAYGIAIAAQLPLLAMYSIELWKRVHYQFFPIAVVFAAYCVWQRWPDKTDRPYSASLLSSALMLIGLVIGVAGAAFVYPWFAAASVVVLVFSLLMRITDEHTGRSLAACALPLIPCVYLPMNFDSRLINWLQRFSASFTSQLLDMVGFIHHMQGTVIRTASGKDFGVAEACSGVTSFFMLVFCAIAMCVYRRSSLLRMLLLVLAAGYWAMMMNTIRIMAIPLADSSFGLDLTSGLLHDALGYLTMGIGFGLLLSTDQLVDWAIGKLMPSLSKRADANTASSRKTEHPIGTLGRGLTWTICAVLLVGGLFSASDVYRNYVARDQIRVRFFDESAQTPLSQSDLPVRVNDWSLAGFQSEDRSRGSDLGQHSDVWQYAAPGCSPTISLDQPFPGWHELTTCYLNSGWKMTSRSVKIPSGDSFGVDGTPWAYVEAEFRNSKHEHAYLLFSFFDGYGQPCEPPADWTAFNAFVQRAQNRLSNRIRSGLFQGSAYQTQAFLKHPDAVDAGLKADLLQKYLVLREELRKQFLQKRRTESGGA